jgi:hypothetical protein
MSKETNFAKALDDCPVGNAGWKEFEDICTEILEYLFMPALEKPIEQAHTYSGVNRRDMVFPNRNIEEGNTQAEKNWHLLYRELDARMILFEYKNYNAMEIGHEEVIQSANYLTQPMGRLGVIIGSKLPNESAHRQRNTIYTNQHKVILFLTKDHLKEMLDIKLRGEEPSNLIVDLVELFYIQHE